MPARLTPRRARPSVERLEDRLTPAILPTGFSETLVASSLAAPTAMEISPDGRLWVLEQAGDVEVFHSGSTSGWTALDIPTSAISSSGERGLLGIAFDPSYNISDSAPDYVYLYYTSTASPNPHNRVSRFTVNNSNPDQPSLGSETVILNLEQLSATNHNGGAIHFGPDGKLYVAVGENAVPSNAQSLNNRLGKILRINPDGSIPTDNPFYNTATGANRAIWALGLRNPFTFAFQPDTGRMYVNDVGQNTWEEVNEGAAGTNYGWPEYEGFSSPTDLAYRDPIFAYGHGSGFDKGFAIVGGAFYNPATPQFPGSYLGKYFFGDLTNRWIRVLDPANNSVSGFATDNPGGTLTNLVDVKVGPDGKLYYLARGSGSTTGVVYRVQYDTTDKAPLLAAINDRSVPASQQVITQALSATDPDGDTITYTATAQSLAYVLDQRFQFYSTGNLYENWGGQGEKWFQAAGNEWHFIYPNGDVFRWDGSSQATGPFVANVGSSYWSDPSLLYNATTNPHATLSIAGTTLTITREAGFTGSFVVTVRATAGLLADVEYFTVTIGANKPPVLNPIADRTVPAGQATVTVPLSASDPDGDALTFSATLQQLAYKLDQELGLFTDGDLFENWGGLNEKWLQGNGSVWYFILPNGELYQWDGSGPGQLTGTLVAKVGSIYWADPSKLYNAVADPFATVSISGSTLTVTRQTSFTGSLFVTVTVSDGSATDTETFNIIIS